MALDVVDSPFDDSPVEEVPLARSPLAVVLCQMRFPGRLSRLSASLEDRRLQTALEGAYPFSDEQDGVAFLLAPGQDPVAQAGPKVWVFKSEDQSRVVHVAGDSISLTMTSYVSRAKFLESLKDLVDVVQKVARPPQCSRLGVRYINRLESDQSELLQWMKELAVGARGVLASEHSDWAGLSFDLSQAAFRFPGTHSSLQARWGLVPPNMTVDPSISPAPQHSWVLDCDSFEESSLVFTRETVGATAERLAERSYRFFRWVVTPDCLARFGPGEEA